MVATAAAATVVLFGGCWAVASAGWKTVPTLVLLFGLFLSVIALFDYPIASTFSSEQVVRRMVLRRQRISWTRIDQLSRTRPALTARWRGLAPGGLVAVVGRRRYLLVDQCESLDELRRIERLLGEDRDELDLDGLPRPGEETEPTWLYRRAKWAPDGVRSR